METGQSVDDDDDDGDGDGEVPSHFSRQQAVSACVPSTTRQSYTQFLTTITVHVCMELHTKHTSDLAGCSSPQSDLILKSMIPVILHMIIE